VDNFHTSIPHSGTRSHLLNTTTRSHTRTPASGEEAAACFESRTRSVRHRLNAPRCVDQYQQWGLRTRFRESRNASCARGIGAKAMSASCPSLVVRTPRGRNSRKGKNALRVALEGSSLAIESPSREYSGHSDQPHVEPRPAFCLHKRVRKDNPPKTKIAYEQHVGGTPQGRKHTVIIGRVWSLFFVPRLPDPITYPQSFC